MNRSRRLGWFALAIGVLAVLSVQRLAPAAGPPLYDGVVVIEPYRWLDPPPGQQGNPQAVSGTEAVVGGQSPQTAFITPEQPPQAQVFAFPGGLVLPPGTTTFIRMAITPVLPQTLPTDGYIAGNVYRISFTDQAGMPVAPDPSREVTVVLRGPADTTGATIEVDTGEGWQRLKTTSAAFAATYVAAVTEFGDFALVAPTRAVGLPMPLEGPPVPLLVGGVLAGGAVAIVAIGLIRRRRLGRGAG